MERAERIVEQYLGPKAVQLFGLLMKQKPESADAIVLIQGDRLDRAPSTYALYKQGFAAEMLITGNNVLVGPGTRPDENDLPLGDLKQYLLERDVPTQAIAIDDGAMNTRDQAANVIKLAKEKGWSKLLIVDSPYRLLRSYLSFVKQMKDQGWRGKLIMHGVEFPWSEAPSGRTRSALQMLQVESEKIQRYASDIATIDEGLEMFD